MSDNPPILTDAEIARIAHQLKNEETARNSLRSVTEQVICDFARVAYDPVNNTHRDVMQKRWDAVIRLQLEQAAADKKAIADKEKREKRREQFLSNVWEKTVSVLTGLALAVGIGWIASKLGVKLPGAQ